MNLSCKNVHDLIHSLPMVQECDLVRSGALRLSTPFVYPNGEHIDLFLEEANSLFGGYRLSDFGQTAHYLRDASSSLDRSARRRQIFADILSQEGVKFDNGDLMVEIVPDAMEQITYAMLKLAQACVRISEFSMHQRLRIANPFKEGVREFLSDRKFPFATDVKVRGRFENDVRLDFAIITPARSSYVLLLTPIDEHASHISSNEIFRKWYDLRDSTPERITVYNSAAPVRKEDLLRLKDQSRVLSFPREQETLESVLKGIAA